MDRATSLRRRIAAFAAVAGVFLAVLVLRSQATSAVKTEGELAMTFPGFEPEKAKTVTVTRKTTRDGKAVEENLRLDLAAPDAWVLSSAHGYPARLDRVKPMLDVIRNSRLVATKTSNESRFANYAGTDGFVEVRVLGAAEEPLASFGIGKGDAEGAWDSSYVRRDPKKGKEKDVVAAKNLASSAFSTGVAEWVEGRLFPTLVNADVAEVLVEQREKGRDIEVVRGAKGEKDTEDPWSLTKPEAGKATSSAANNLIGAVTGLTLDDVVDSAKGPEADAKYGFDKPEVVVTAKGKAEKAGAAPTYRVTVGKKAEGKTAESFYVRKDDEPFVFTVAGYKLQDFRAEPSTFLEKKPDEKPAGEVKPGDGPDGAPMGETPPPGVPPPAVPPPTAPTPAPGMTDEPAMNPEPPAPPAMSDAPPPAPPAMSEK